MTLRVNTPVVYFSTSQNAWVPTLISHIGPKGAVQVACNLGTSIPPEEMQHKIYAAGLPVEYFCSFTNTWITTRIKTVALDGALQVACNVGTWIERREIPQRLRVCREGPSKQVASVREPDIALAWLTMKEGTEDFVERATADVCESRKESENVRFDMLRSVGSPHTYIFFEVYKSKLGAAAHQEQCHCPETKPWVKEHLAENGRDRRRYRVHGGKGLAAFRGGDMSPDNDVTLVHVSCKPGTENEFIEATLKNQAGVIEKEPDAIRFDILQQEDDPTKFVLFEVFKNADAVAHHKTLKHFLDWRQEVEDMMAERRRGEKVQIVPVGKKTAPEMSPNSACKVDASIKGRAPRVPDGGEANDHPHRAARRDVVPTQSQMRRTHSPSGLKPSSLSPSKDGGKDVSRSMGEVSAHAAAAGRGEDMSREGGIKPASIEAHPAVDTDTTAVCQEAPAAVPEEDPDEDLLMTTGLSQNDAEIAGDGCMEKL